MKMFYRYAIPICIGLIIYFTKVPDSLDQRSWNLLSIFIATIVAMVTRPLPMGGIALVSLTISMATNTIDDSAVFSGFSNNTVWLVVLIFFVTRAFVKSGLGQRIAYYLISKIGSSSLGMAYSLVFTELFIAPFIPSIATRAGGIIFPILRSITETFENIDENKSHKPQNLGGFLILTSYHANYITGAMFLTAMAANPMMQSFAADQSITITWSNWAIAAVVPGLISLLLIPLFIYYYFPPEIKYIENAKEIAIAKMQEMGSLKIKEIILMLVFIIMLSLWFVGERFGISITATALFSVSILIFFNIILIEDILNEKEAWHTLLWFSILIMLSKHLQLYGLVDWFSGILGSNIKGLSWEISLISIVIIYFYSHYFFASISTHVSAMYPALLALAVQSGAPGLLAALVLAFTSNLYASLTHFGSTTAVIFAGARMVPINIWWKVGFITSIINILIWGISGTIWWKIINLI